MKPRFLVAATNSGVGKTTMCMALHSHMCARGLRMDVYKTGPDFIDTRLHTAVGRAYGMDTCAHNIDGFLMSEQTIRGVMASRQDASDGCLIEGVMGLYDGMGTSNIGGSSHVASVTGTPTVLVVDGRGMALSAAAMVRGYASFMDGVNVAGVIFNRVSPGRGMDLLSEVIARHTNVRVYGCLPACDDINIGAMEMGLLPPEAIEDINGKIRLAGKMAGECIDTDALLELKSAHLHDRLPDVPFIGNLRIGIAMDEAFGAYYDDGLDVWRAAGAQFVPFSPLHDACLPANLDAVMMSGLARSTHVGALHGNTPMREHIKKSGLPMWTEGFGTAYAGKSIDGLAMCGCLSLDSVCTQKLVHFGYTESGAGRVQEYRRMDGVIEGANIEAHKPGSPEVWKCGLRAHRIFALWPHMHALGVGCADTALDFMRECLR